MGDAGPAGQVGGTGGGAGRAPGPARGGTGRGRRTAGATRARAGDLGGRVAAYVPLPSSRAGRRSSRRWSAAVPDVLLPVAVPDRDLDWARYDGFARPGSAAGLAEPPGPGSARPRSRASTWCWYRRWRSISPGARLGRGGGSYDRALARVAGYPRRGAALRRTSSGRRCPAEPHDRPVTAVLTPAGLIRSSECMVLGHAGLAGRTHLVRQDWHSTSASAGSAAIRGGLDVPTYQYACTACGHQLEAVQSFTDAALTVCPACDGQLRKLFSAVGIVFKGSGFYRNDSRRLRVDPRQDRWPASSAPESKPALVGDSSSASARRRPPRTGARTASIFLAAGCELVRRSSVGRRPGPPARGILCSTPGAPQ